jgi:hypothetical protein
VKDSEASEPSSSSRFIEKFLLPPKKKLLIAKFTREKSEQQEAEINLV